MPELLDWLEATQIGILARESDWGFHILVGTHIIGLIFSVGALLWIDLRLLGVAMAYCPVTILNRRLLPVALFGFFIMVASGTALFLGYANEAYDNLFFRLKIAAMLLAGINALLYHRGIEQRIAQWQSASPPPRAARLAGLFSLLLWVAVILCGRAMSYTMF